IIIAADYKRTTSRYGERGIRYVHNEVGHCGQNIHLQCEALGLGTVVIGAFSDERVKKILNIKEEPQYIMPVGRKK
ncbi:MAG: SagB/ThcOx family dehydrogenase, partial [candidate division WOR-3 bacterium]